MARMSLIPERKEMKGGRSGVSLRAANWSEDGGAPRRGPAFISSRRKRSVISSHFTELIFYYEIEYLFLSAEDSSPIDV